MLKITFIVVGLSSLTLTSCTSMSRPKVSPEGKGKTASTQVLEKGAQFLQSNAAVAGMNIYMVGPHPMKEHPSYQMEAHHFCREVNEEFSQCVLFDGNTKDANLNGVEYIISERLFNGLPENEKKYWHPHNYEILSGQVIAPGLPESTEKALLKKKINSYGKTWHFWNTGHYGMNDGTNVPMGDPMLAWSFNRDGEALAGLLKEEEEKFNFKIKEKRNERDDLSHLAHPQRGEDAIEIR